MVWLKELFYGPGGVAHAVLVLGLVAALGLGLGTLKIRGVGLGVAGVLFVGLIFGHFGIQIDPTIRNFAREFGLILFVYAIGMQVGPGFFGSLRKQGLPLNLMAGAVVLLGVVLTLILAFWVLGGKQLPVAVGLFAGATTNTPSLAAAEQALSGLGGAEDVRNMPGLAYAVAYPIGIIGIIATMILMRVIFRISPHREAEALEALQRGKEEPLTTMNLEVRNPNLDGLQLTQIPTLGESGVAISRIKQGSRVTIVRPDTVIRMGDVLHAVGPAKALDQLRLVIGEESPINVSEMPSNITTRRILVTRSAALGKTVHELDLRSRYNVTVTRVHRAEIELPVTPGLRLQFGDNLVVVGEDAAIRQVSAVLGDSPKQLTHPQIIPVFVGIALGVILGSWPFYFPNMSVPVHLGLAGGPLLVAILLSRLGNIGPLVWYMPISANFILREVGIALFLACVGLRAGDQFIRTLVDGPGLYWIGYAALIAVVPLLIVALFARIVYKQNYLTMCGLLAGSMTDPPALAFAGSMTGSDAPSVSYATVYPLVMLLRVISAQAMVVFFFR